MYWGQRARIKWLNEGDKNTKFFHASVIQRRRRNRIYRIQNNRGEWVEGKEETFAAILEHYEQVYKFDRPMGIDGFFENIPSLVTPDMNDKLMATF